MNESEIIAKHWLIKKGYNKEDIRKNHLTPDFICEDGKRYEVKRLYGSKLVFYGHQINSLKDDDIILVVDKEKVIKSFLWKDKDNVPFEISQSDDKIPPDHILIQIHIPKELNKMIEIHKIIWNKKDKKEVIIQILEEKFRNKKEYQF